MSDVKISGPVSVRFTPQGISYILDTLASCPWKMANPLINDIMTQLKTQEGERNGPVGLGEAIASGRDSCDSSGGVPPVEAQ